MSYFESQNQSISKFKKMKKLIIAILLAFTSTCNFAQLDRSKAPTPGPAPEINIGEPQVFELDNGLKVILSSNHRQPKVSINLVLTSSPRLEKDKAGLSEMMGSLLLSGTSNRDKDQLDNEKDFIGATLSASSDGIYLSCLTKHIGTGLELMKDVMRNASFPESEFERIKKQFESGLASAKTNASTMATNAVYRSVFPKNHPYGEIMTPKSLSKITRQDVVDFYKEQFTPSGSYLVIVGDINIEGAKKIANGYFADWEGGVPFEKEYNEGFFPESNRVIFVEKPGAVQSNISIAFSISMKPGDEDQIKLSVLNKILGGGGFGTRLMQNLREDKAWTYGAYSNLSVNRYGSWIVASGSFRNSVTDSTITELLNEFQRITDDFVTEEELELNKASMAGSFARSLEQPRTVANFALNIFRNELPSDYYQTYLQKLNAVSKKDVIDVAKKYITPNNLNIIVVGNPEVVDLILPFDGDGEIEYFDAFGNPTSSKTYLPSEISKEEVIENYLMAVTQTNTIEKANKAISKIKSVEQTMSIKFQQAPAEFIMKSYFVAPYSRMTVVELNERVLQKEVFNGKAGRSQRISQTGALDRKELTPEEVENKRKLSGLFPELGLQCGGVEFTLLGIDEVNNGKFYVIEYTSNDITTRAYYDVNTFMKKQTESLTVVDDEPQNTVVTYSNFKEHKGILFPEKNVQFMGSAGFDSTLKEIKVNKKISKDKFAL